jgi:hypothetical protein
LCGGGEAKRKRYTEHALKIAVLENDLHSSLEKR